MRYLVLRVPTSGPPALVAQPNDFATRAEAEARAQAIEGRTRMVHHTWIDIVAYDGPLDAFLAAEGILR